VLAIFDGNENTFQIFTSISATGWREATPQEIQDAQEGGLIILNLGS
jgi:hypothetical protein